MALIILRKVKFMKTDYVQITYATGSHTHNISTSFKESSVGVYLNGMRLFLDLDFRITGSTIKLLIDVIKGDLLIVSYQPL